MTYKKLDMNIYMYMYMYIYIYIYITYVILDNFKHAHMDGEY